MRVIRLLILLGLLFVALYYIYDVNNLSNKDILEAEDQPKLSRKPESYSSPPSEDVFDGDIYDWIGTDTSELQDEFGEPERKDASLYDYTWWIYNEEEESSSSDYIQFGVQDDTIETIFVTGESASLSPLSLKDNFDAIQENISLETDINISNNGSDFIFHLSEEDMQTRPLVQIDDDLFMQLYIDTFDDSLVAARIATSDILLSLRPYELRYQGSLPEEPEWSDTEREDIDRGMEQQIFDITNVFREQFGKESVKWNEDARQVALSHSKDMENQDYFSHESPDGAGLMERLDKYDVSYQTAGENIAADYIDGPAAVAGWLNSKDHRDILLEDEFTHLGVGVYRKYFTQNYLK